MIKLSWLAPVVALAAAPVSIPKTWSARERAAAEAVSERAVRAHVGLLADDLLEGRAAGSRGDALAMRYVAAEYERLGLEPAGDAGGYLQRLELVGMTTTASAPPTVRAPGGKSLALAVPSDAIVAAGQQRASASIDGAEIVFVGYGITAPEQKWDDWKGVDVRGKVVLVMNDDPSSDPSLFGGKARLYYGRWTYKLEEAARHGAAGAILVHTTPSAGYPWQVVTASWTGEQFDLPSPAGGPPRLVAQLWATEEASRKIAALGGHDLDELRRRAESRDFAPVPLGVTLSVALATKLRRLETANVLGVLRGDGPLAGEAVVVTAHHDHLGMRPDGAKDGDAIYNGALDNASGVAALLATAEGLAAARPRPKRSVLFAAVAAEESGLLGSRFLVAHPPFPVGKLAADFNLDGLNVWGRTADVSVIGLGKSSLDDVLRRAAAEQGREVVPDQVPEIGLFYRSDQLSFARAGVPSAYLMTGGRFLGHDETWGKQRIDEYIQKRYHQPSDQLDASWRLDGAVDDLRLLAVALLRVADAPSPPVWRPGDEFEAARKAAPAK